MKPKPTTHQVQKLVQQIEAPRHFYLGSSQITNSAGQKTWSSILVEDQKILARFNNSKVIRPLEAKAYAILRTIYWLIEQKITTKITLWTDNYDLWRRFIKLCQRKVETGYQIEREFYFTKRGQIAWPNYLWMARKLIAEHNLDCTVDYQTATDNPASQLTKTIKICAKCSQLKKIAPSKRNCYSCWKASQQTQYERWKAWHKELKRATK
jgi:hypothetical protein